MTRLTIDLIRDKIVVGPTNPALVAALGAKRGNSNVFVVQFVSNGAGVDMGDAEFRIGVKPKSALGGDSLVDPATVFTKSGSGTSALYTVDPEWDTLQIKNAFGTSEPLTLACILDIQWLPDGEEEFHATQGVALTLENDVTRGDESLVSATQPIGTAAYRNVPSSGNATSLQVVLGSDTRLAASIGAATSAANLFLAGPTSGGSAVAAFRSPVSADFPAGLSFTTPTIGVASATSVNKVALTAPATSATLTIADGKTLTVSNTLTFTGTNGSTLNIGGGGTLGSAAFTATSAYATAVQGTKADNALPLAGGTMTGTLNTRDISVGSGYAVILGTNGAGIKLVSSDVILTVPNGDTAYLSNTDGQFVMPNGAKVSQITSSDDEGSISWNGTVWQLTGGIYAYGTSTFDEGQVYTDGAGILHANNGLHSPYGGLTVLGAISSDDARFFTDSAGNVTALGRVTGAGFGATNISIGSPWASSGSQGQIDISSDGTIGNSDAGTWSIGVSGSATFSAVNTASLGPGSFSDLVISARLGIISDNGWLSTQDANTGVAAYTNLGGGDIKWGFFTGPGFVSPYDVMSLTSGGTLGVNAISGDGSALTGLDAANISSGTLADAYGGATTIRNLLMIGAI